MEVINIAFWLIICVVLVIFFVIMLLYIRKKRELTIQKKLLMAHNKLLKSLVTYEKQEDFLNEILKLVSKIVISESYYFYQYDDKNHEYRLITSYNRLNMDLKGKAQMHKAGPLPTKKGIASYPKQIGIIKEDDLSLLAIPIKNNKGFIYATPVDSTSKQVVSLLMNVRENIAQILDVMEEIKTHKNKVNNIPFFDDELACSKNGIGIESDSLFSAVIAITIKTIGAKGGFFLSKEDETYNVVSVIGLDPYTANVLKQDKKTLKVLYSFTKEKDVYFTIRNDCSNLDSAYLEINKMDYFLILKAESPKQSGTAVFWFNNEADIIRLKNISKTVFKTLKDRFEAAITDYEKYNLLTDMFIYNYTAFLELNSLANILESIDPYSAGFTELTAKYSKVIAKMLGLDAKDIKEIETAAKLSDIGILGLSNELIFKRGKYNELDYADMKLHSEYGASIVKTVLGNKRIASYIRYHHEKVDGSGYPEGLKDDQIPTGAKIIGVVQSFLGKIKGRNYREPLAFEKALLLLKKEAGTQLDTHIVNILIEFFKNKIVSTISEDRSLGYCWDMRCLSKTMCSSCPAYKNYDANCWEIEDTHCIAHGNKCETCFVYTAYLYKKSYHK